MEESSRNWHAALPAVEPGVTHSNTALTFSLLLCSSGHNSLTCTFFLSFVSPLVLSYTPLSMIPFISLYPAHSLSVLSVSICSRTSFCLWSDSSAWIHLTAGFLSLCLMYVGHVHARNFEEWQPHVFVDVNPLIYHSECKIKITLLTINICISPHSLQINTCILSKLINKWDNLVKINV